MIFIGILVALPLVVLVEIAEENERLSNGKEEVVDKNQVNLSKAQDVNNSELQAIIGDLEQLMKETEQLIKEAEKGCTV